MLEFLLTWWWALLLIPLMGIGLTEVVLSNIQKLFGFKFPLIGDFIIRRDKESIDSIAKHDRDLKSSHKDTVAFLFVKRTLTDTEMKVAEKVFETTDNVELISHLLNTERNLDSKLRKILEERYLKMNGDSFY